MEQVFDAFNNILALLITEDAIIIMAVIISLTEMVRRFCKSPKVQERYPKVRALGNWEIRVLAFILGLVITAIWLSDTWKKEFVYGLFYGGVAPLTIMFIKHVLVKKYFPTLYEKWD